MNVQITKITPENPQKNSSTLWKMLNISLPSVPKDTGWEIHQPAPLKPIH